MDSGMVVIIAIFACIVFGALLVFRRQADIRVKVLGGELVVKGDNSSPVALTAEDAVSRKGGLKMTDETGYGASATRVEVETDIEMTSKPPTRSNVPKG